MSRRKILIAHLAVWIILSVIYFLTSESVVKFLMPGFDDVAAWLAVLATGLIVIFVGVTSSLTIMLLRRGRK